MGAFGIGRYVFRGKGIDGKWHHGLVSMSHGSPSQPDRGCYISNEVGQPWAYQVRLDTLGQWTGLVDCEGTPIYEGDIGLLSPSAREYMVVWYNSGWVLRRGGRYTAIEPASVDFTVTGNTHEWVAVADTIGG